MKSINLCKCLDRTVEILDVVIDLNSGSMFIVENEWHKNLLNSIVSYKPVKNEIAISFLNNFIPRLAYQHFILINSKNKYNV